MWEEVRGKESLGDTHQESDTHDQNNNWVERSTSEESPNLIFESDTSNHSSATNPYLQLSTSASADGDVFEVLSKCSSGEKINESSGDDDNDSATPQSTILTDVCVPLSSFPEIISATAKDVADLGVIGP